MIQTTINLSKVEILQFQCSAEADHQSFRKSHSKSRTRQDQPKMCISQDEIKQRSVEQVVNTHAQHDVHAVKIDGRVQDHKEQCTENESDHPGEDQSGALQKPSSQQSSRAKTVEEQHECGISLVSMQRLVPTMQKAQHRTSKW